MAPHSSILAWKIPWTEEPGRLQSMGSLRVRHDWAASRSLFTSMHWRRKWQPTPVFLPGESRDGGAWWAAVYGVAQSRTQLKWLSSSSSMHRRIEFVVQSLSRIWLFATPWTAACQASLSFTVSWKFPQIHVHWVDDAVQPSTVGQKEINLHVIRSKRH